MEKPKIFVSFDFKNDRNYKHTLNMWNENSSFEFTYNDISSRKNRGWVTPLICSILLKKIAEATHVIVVVGREANQLHEDSNLIKYRNWQNFEIAQAKSLHKPIIVVQLNSLYEYPDELKNCDVVHVCNFNYDDIIKAIKDCTNRNFT